MCFNLSFCCNIPGTTLVLDLGSDVLVIVSGADGFAGPRTLPAASPHASSQEQPLKLPVSPQVLLSLSDRQTGKRNAYLNTVFDSQGEGLSMLQKGSLCTKAKTMEAPEMRYTAASLSPPPRALRAEKRRADLNAKGRLAQTLFTEVFATLETALEGQACDYSGCYAHNGARQPADTIAISKGEERKIPGCLKGEPTYRDPCLIAAAATATTPQLGDVRPQSSAAPGSVPGERFPDPRRKEHGGLLPGVSVPAARHKENPLRPRAKLPSGDNPP
ncbi:hypothetical protein AAFF_G00306380 [Aldrovandia affinis]|uniref:Uncharacterized protein n=1 Tax=Aldrovandia affinis TaxID=143900 RepID=A0AAD7WRB8_9TELE|nr:hypothetical protein AAFF_G00306380 [Aldrovandia affinis]